MNKIAVVLSGCGVFDGAEINEAVLTLLALEERGILYDCFAPDISQHHVVDHANGNEVSSQQRNVLSESARIVRGNIKPTSELNVSEYAGLLVPGGFGVAKNLSTFALEGSNFTIESSFLKVMTDFAHAKKPSGYMCIAPVLLPKVYQNIRCTIGHDADTAAIIEELGGSHIKCDVDDIVIDEAHNVVTTPAYMLAETIIEARKGINKLVDKVIQMV